MDFSESIDKRSLESVYDILLRAFDKEAGGLYTGISALDELTSGFLPGELIVLAARPSMGKSSLAYRIAESVALDNRQTVVLYGLEILRKIIVENMVCSRAGVSIYNFRRGQASSEEHGKLAKVAGEFRDCPLYISDIPGLTPARVLSETRLLPDVKLIIIDYLQLMRANSENSRDIREQVVASIMRDLKLVANRLQVPIILLAQLNRGVEGREDKRPRLSDLRESGEIEQSADIVWLLYRDEYYNPDTELVGTAEVIQAKNRRGPTTTAKLFFEKSCMRFDDFLER